MFDPTAADDLTLPDRLSVVACTSSPPSASVQRWIGAAAVCDSKFSPGSGRERNKSVITSSVSCVSNRHRSGLIDDETNSAAADVFRAVLECAIDFAHCIDFVDPCNR